MVSLKWAYETIFLIQIGKTFWDDHFNPNPILNWGTSRFYPVLYRVNRLDGSATMDVVRDSIEHATFNIEDQQASK